MRILLFVFVVMCSLSLSGSGERHSLQVHEEEYLAFGKPFLSVKGIAATRHSKTYTRVKGEGPRTRTERGVICNRLCYVACT
jgi:hypothetical protein